MGIAAERIVICEDDEDLAFVLREALIRKEYEVEIVPTAGKLLDRLGEAAYDLILLDVRLPDMDGLDAISKCRELAPETPIIVMTAHGTRPMAIDAVNRGAYDFFTKPLKMAEFQVVVARALDRRRLQQQVKALLDEGAGWLVRFVGPGFAWLKIAGFLLLQGSLAALVVVSLWAVFRGSAENYRGEDLDLDDAP